MYLPEGTHEICATVNGKPGRRTVRVDRGCVAALQAALEERMAGGAVPVFFFDHKRGPAAAYPDRFEYGETSDGRAGVMAHIARWTPTGRSRVEGGEYNGFSPTFLLGADGRPAGLPSTTAEVGSLTNEPAFTANARIAAAAANDALVAVWKAEAAADPSYEVVAAAWEQFSSGVEPQEAEAEQRDEMKAYIAEKLGLPADAGEDEVKAAFDRFLDAGGTDEVRAAEEGEVEELREKLQAAEELLAEANARCERLTDSAFGALVQAAVRDGKIAPKDTRTVETLRASYERDPEATADLIAAMNCNPAMAGRKMSFGGEEEEAPAEQPRRKKKKKTEEEYFGYEDEFDD